MDNELIEAFFCRNNWRNEMAVEDFEQEVHFYQQPMAKASVQVDLCSSLEHEIPFVFARFEALSRENRTHFQRLCARLLEDEQWRVRLGTIKLLHSAPIRDDILAILLVTCALKQEDLREEALSSLKRVGTRVVLPQLLLLAEEGNATALDMVRRTSLTPDQRTQGIAIARTYLDASDYRLREAALFFLQKHSSLEQEAARVLSAVEKYLDELFIDALKKAPPELALEPLKNLRSSFEANYANYENYAEYRDMSSTIYILEQKVKAT